MRLCLADAGTAKARGRTHTPVILATDYSETAGLSHLEVPAFATILGCTQRAAGLRLASRPFGKVSPVRDFQTRVGPPVEPRAHGILLPETRAQILAAVTGRIF